MAEQKALFGFEDMRPKLGLKKIITRERMEEGKRLMKKGDNKGAAALIRDIRYKLEAIERSISNKPEDTAKTVKRAG
jgi:hypothetical protein